jgi:hypothetical protein
MSMAIDLEWERDEAGYDLLPSRPATDPAPEPVYMSWFAIRSSGEAVSHTESIVESTNPTYARIMRRGGNLLKYRPFQARPELCRIFAVRARTTEGLLHFVNEYGPLTTGGNKLWEDVRFGLGQAEMMYRLYQYSPRDRSAYLMRSFPRGFLLAVPIVLLVGNTSTGMPEMAYKVGTLSQALWLEFSQNILNGRTIRECALCGSLFETGPGARRADAKFCCDEHRTTFHNQRKREQT